MYDPTIAAELREALAERIDRAETAREFAETPREVRQAMLDQWASLSAALIGFGITAEVLCELSHTTQAAVDARIKERESTQHQGAAPAGAPA